MAAKAPSERPAPRRDRRRWNPPAARDPSPVTGRRHASTSMHRRQFLRSTVGAASAAVLGTTSGTVVPPAERAGTRRRARTRRRPRTRRVTPGAYRTVVDAVEAGADPDGGEPIDGAVEPLLSDDTLVWFPAGTYALGRLHVRDVEHLALQARPGERATIVPARPATAVDHRFVTFDGVHDLAVAGFDLDYRAPGRGGAFRVVGAGDFSVRDLRVRGRMPDRDLPASPAAFRFDVGDASATGLVEGLVARDGGHDGGNAVGIYVGHDHAGTLLVRDCEIAGFPNNGLYASSPGIDRPGFRGRDGPVHVRGGVYRNNNVAGVRLGSTGSTARGVRIVIDRTPPDVAGTHNARGLRLRGRHGQVIEDCEIVLGPDAGFGFGGLVVHPDAGRATVRNTAIRVDADGRHAVNVLPVGDVDGPVGTTLDGVSITGSAAGGTAVLVRGRRGWTLQDCAVHQDGTDRDGLVFEDCRNCAVVDTIVDVTGTPLRRTNSDVRARGLATGEARGGRGDRTDR